MSTSNPSKIEVNGWTIAKGGWADALVVIILCAVFTLGTVFGLSL